MTRSPECGDLAVDAMIAIAHLSRPHPKWVDGRAIDNHVIAILASYSSGRRTPVGGCGIAIEGVADA
jgi:hypothetical protein